jgi:23S rRNA (cytosine1962-C5)-methyltransferase
MTKVFLHGNISSRIQQGHPWVFANEVQRAEPAPTDGSIADVFTAKGKFLGRGYFNAKSQIRIRLLTRKKTEAIDEAFFQRRIQAAWAYRQKIGYEENCRLVFGEADGLPGLIIDKFNEYLVLQTLALGIESWKPQIVEIVSRLFHPAGIFERNDVPVRELEGMGQQKGFLSPVFPTTVTIRENGLQFLVDLENGQKTGYFLDQHENRQALSQIARGAEVLGAFCYTGSFELHAAHYGAKSVLGLDISPDAIALATRNAALNALESRTKFECQNAFDALHQWSREGRDFDIVMLDPPAFTKSRDSVEKAITGYKEINLRGIKMVRRGGFLVTSSCSNHIGTELFLRIVEMAAKDAGRRVRQFRFSQQAPDHPVVWGLENTHYLKFLIIQVL